MRAQAPHYSAGQGVIGIVSGAARRAQAAFYTLVTSAVHCGLRHMASYGSAFFYRPSTPLGHSARDTYPESVIS
jgi:hypothetical protein